jgi:hypothetical protein
MRASDRLRALAKGYFGLNWVFLANVLLSVASFVVTRGPDAGLQASIATAVLVFLVITAASFPFNREIGAGKGWSPVGPVIASLLMGLNSALCCGIIGYLVMQSIAMNEMKRLGLRAGFLGVRRKDVDALAEALDRTGGEYPRQQIT